VENSQELIGTALSERRKPGSALSAKMRREDRRRGGSRDHRSDTGKADGGWLVASDGGEDRLKKESAPGKRGTCAASALFGKLAPDSISWSAAGLRRCRATSGVDRRLRSGAIASGLHPGRPTEIADITGSQRAP